MATQPQAASTNPAANTPETFGVSALGNKFTAESPEVRGIQTAAPQSLETAIGSAVMQEERTKPSMLSSNNAKKQVQKDIAKLDSLDENKQQVTAPKSESQIEPEPKSLEEEFGDDPIIQGLETIQQGANEANAALVSSIKAKYARRKEQQRDISKRRQAGLTLIGQRAGRQRYAPERQESILSAEERAGVQALADLDAEEQTLIAQARQAKMAQDFQTLSQMMGRYDQLQKQKTQKAQDLFNQMVAQERLALDKARFEMEDVEFLQAQQDRARDDLYTTLDTGINLDELSQEQVAEIEEKTGFSISMVRRMQNIRQQKAKAKSVKDNLALATDMVNLLSDIPTGETLMVGDTEYTGLGSPDVNTQIFREVDGNGNITFVTVDKNTGEIVNTADGGKTSPKTTDFKAVTDLRKEFNSQPEVKSYKDLQRTYSLINTAYQTALSKGDKGSKASADQALVTLYNKMLDPGSVVREGEYARTAEGQALIDRFVSKYQQATEGGAGITDVTRKDMVDISQKFFEGAQGDYDKIADYYRYIAKEIGVDPSLVIRETGQPVVPGAPQPIQPTQPSQLLEESVVNKIKEARDSGEYTDVDIVNSIAENEQYNSFINSALGTGRTASEIVDYLIGENQVEQTDSLDIPGIEKIKKKDLGSLSERYESGGDPGAIGYDRTGGYSYGAYQLAHNNAKKFIDNSIYKDEFKGLDFNSKAWQNKWKQIAQQDPEMFKQAQKEYIGMTHLKPQVEKIIKETDISLNDRNPVLLDVIWSTAVQYGPKTNVVTNAIKKVGKGASDEDIIRAIYDERWSGGKRFASSTAQVKQGVYNRFFGQDGELNMALRQLA